MQIKDVTISDMFDNNVRAENIYHLGTQAINDSLPDSFENLILDNWVEFWDLLGVSAPDNKSDAEIFEEISWDLRRKYRKTGFMVRFAYPVPQNFSADFTSWDFSWSFFTTKLIYGETLQDCCEQALEAQQEYIKKKIQKAKG